MTKSCWPDDVVNFHASMVQLPDGQWRVWCACGHECHTGTYEECAEALESHRGAPPNTEE